MSLETITGNLRDVYKQLQPGTMMHVDELMNERRTNEELRQQFFDTADGAAYFLDGVSKTPTFAITREAQNPVLQNIDNAFVQLVNNHNYRPSQEDVQQALTAPDTVLIALPKLRLLGNDTEWRYLGFGTTPAKYAKLNEEERKFAERVYGQGDDFAQNMQMLKKAGISETRIFVLNPDYVRKQAETSAVARASWLSNFNYDSNFDAGGRDIDSRDRVRGVRRGVVAAGAKNLGPFRTPAPNVFKAHYDAILADQESAVKALDDKTAAGLAGLMQAYLASRGQ